MKRDIIGDIFLGGVLLSLLFVFSFPVLFAYNANIPRDISFAERIMSVCFVLGFVLTGVWACWKKKIWVALGLAMFAILPYIPKWFLPKVYMNMTLHGKNIGNSLLAAFLNRIYELTHAPFAGLIGMVSEKTAEQLAYRMLPSIIIGYILARIIAFYYKAYVDEKKQKHDFAHFRRVQEHQAPAMAAAAAEAPAPLGTVIVNENNEIAKETYSVKPQEAPTMQMNVEAPAPMPAIEGKAEETQVISLAAQAPTSKPAEPEVISLSAQAPTSKPVEQETAVIQLSAHAPTSETKETKTDAPSEETADDEDADMKIAEPNLDFPDIRGEAEKIDVFGDDEK